MKKSDIEFSQQGEKEVKKDFPDPTAHEIMTAVKDGTYESSETPESDKVIFKLAHKKNGRYWMDGIADVINPKTGRVERVRLLTGVDTIWMKEQKDVDKEYANKNRRSLVFEDGVCILNKLDVTAIEFARLNNGFLEKKDRKTGAKHEYYEWNPKRQEAEAFQKELEEQEVMELAMSQTFENVKKHASFLGGISFVDEHGLPRTEKGIRVLYVREARKNPKRFKSTLNSKEVEVAFLIKRAILDSKIDLGGNTGSIKWANGGFICKLPAGRQPQEYLIELALLPNEEGKQFLQNLQEKT